MSDMQKKKVVGFSFGRKLGNTEVLIKEALLKCSEAGFDIQFVRCDDLDIHPCTGCCVCVAQLAMCKGSGKCHLKDDFPVIHEALMSADAVIVGSPTYVLAPTGKFKVVCDRMGPSHDITFAMPAIEAGQKEGRPRNTYPDVRFLKKRVAALITVGGAKTENWLSLAMPNMFEFTLSMGMDVIDKLQYHAAMEHEHVIGRTDMIARAAKLGGHIVDALNARTEEERVRFRGDDWGVCPVCHERNLTIMGRGSVVECPVCGIEGTLTLEDGGIKVVFPSEQIARSRLYEAGKWEHSNEIRGGFSGITPVEDLAEKKKRYIGVGE